MKSIMKTIAPALPSVALLFGISVVSAQDNPAPSNVPQITTGAPSPAVNVPMPSPGQNGGDRTAQFLQRINEMIKTTLKASDDEWAVIQPLLEKVQTKQRETMMGRFGGFMGRRGGDRPDRPASPEVDSLKATLESESSSPADIKAKLEAVRAARKKIQTELDQAREDLRKVLTQRQEASLVMLGILE